MGLLKREDLLKKDKLDVVKVDLSNDEFVYVRQMTGHDRDVFENSIMKARRNSKGIIETYDTILENFRTKLLVMTLCDDKGELLLTIADADALGKSMSAKKIDKIVEAAQKINAISEQDKEDLVKNSVADQVGNSTSDSAEN